MACADRTPSTSANTNQSANHVINNLTSTKGEGTIPRINWDEVFEAGEADEKPPPASTYVVEVEKAEWTKSSTDKDMLKVRARIVSGPEKNKALFTQITLTLDNPFAMKKARQHLAALGLGKRELTTLTDEEQGEHVIGVRCKMVTEIDKKYDPKNPRAKVKDIIGIADDEDKPSSKKAADTAPPKKVKPPVVDDDDDDDDDVEEEPAPKKKRKPEPEPVEDDDDDEEEAPKPAKRRKPPILDDDDED